MSLLVRKLYLNVSALLEGLQGLPSKEVFVLLQEVVGGFLLKIISGGFNHGNVLRSR